MEENFDSTTYDALFLTMLETICHRTLPDALKKSTALDSRRAVRIRASFNKRLMRIILIQDGRAAAAKLTGFDRIHSFERPARYVVT